MTKFEQLADNVRSLLLTKLQVELIGTGCDSLATLAYKKHKKVTTIWREICQKSGQQNCTIPSELLYPACCDSAAVPDAQVALPTTR
jgi:hypothetical protein